ncbi:hypothetical protein GCK72_024721 [Caenorhabditis remanei]|uniref:Uncharacterized protein n=1 Tax=Caenorhabditis remanei TaxID=31234 RepID=A0A6A5G0U0_CAERE|nr:hypothetical protein GCK72_024721 [Caenorhabditis remanei]KAF1748254.1 hypothetical protein GCK72_024721 [Caenorhabditis remanei]
MGSTCSTPSYPDPVHNIPTIPKTPFGPLPVYKQQPKHADVIEQSDVDPDQKEQSDTGVTAESTPPDSLEQKEEEITTEEDGVAQDSPPASSVPNAPECE